MNTPDLYPPPVLPVPTDFRRPFWSVMIPTFNCADYLVETLKSVLQQAPGPEEMHIEVIDDCSTKDDPEKVVREIGKGRVQFYRQPKNGGAIPNFNTCVHRSIGYWVHVLHGDDYVLPGFYEALRAGCESSPEIGAAHCRNAYVDEYGKWTAISFQHRPTPGINVHFLHNQAVINQIMTPSIVVKREVYERVGAFNPKYPHSADWDMWNRAGRYYQVWCEPKVLACYREHTASDTSKLKKTGANIRDGHQYIRNQYEHLPPQEGEEITRQALKQHAYYANWIAERMLGFGDLDAAIAQLEEGLNCYYLPELALKKQKVERLKQINFVSSSTLESKQTENLIKHYQQVLSLNPEDWEAHTRLGEFYYIQNDLEKSLYHSKNALRIRPDANIYKNLGDVMQQQGNLESAFQFYSKAKELRWDWAEIHGCLGTILSKRGRWKQALEEYIVALTIQPNFALVYWHLHQVWQEMERPKEAVSCLYQAFRLDVRLATQIEEFVKLGNQLLVYDKLSEAIFCFQYVLQVNPNLEEAQRGLAKASTT